MINYSISPTSIADLPFIYSLFDEAIEYQKRNQYPVWKSYDKDVLQQDIKDGRQFKILVNNQITWIFSYCLSDPVIWRQRDRGDAIYLHRIVVNPTFKGQKNFGKILTWSINFVQKQQLKFIRMDTWANNPSLVNYYLDFGFEIVDYFTTPNSLDIPIQQRNNEVVLLEFKVTSH